MNRLKGWMNYEIENTNLQFVLPKGFQEKGKRWIIYLKHIFHFLFWRLMYPI